MASRRFRVPRGIAAAATSFALVVASAASANQFIGDLVYCDVGGQRGAYEPEAGDYGIDGVEVQIECEDTAGHVCDVTTTTGAFHASVVQNTFASVCGAHADYDLTDAGARTGRYAVNLLRPETCLASGFTIPVSCTVTINPDTLPANCDALVTPSVAAPIVPADGNADGDFCDPEDGPFAEGQILGDNGADQAICQMAASGPADDGVHTTHVTQPPSGTSCSLYADFGYEAQEQECIPCVKKEHRCGRGHPSSYMSLKSSSDERLPYCPSGKVRDGAIETSTGLHYCPVEKPDDRDHGKHHRKWFKKAKWQPEHDWHHWNFWRR